MKLYDNRVVILAPGKPQPLAEYPRPVKTVTVVAFAANTEAVHIGGAGVRARAGEATGLPLLGGSRPDSATFDDVDLSQVWIDANVEEEGVTFLAQE